MEHVRVASPTPHTHPPHPRSDESPGTFENRTTTGLTGLPLAPHDDSHTGGSGSGGEDPVSATVIGFLIGLAGLIAGGLVAVALAASWRRRTRSHLLVTLALLTLGSRSVVGGAAILGGVGSGPHHAIEHGLDVLTLGLLLAAVMAAGGRSTRPQGAGR